jgi:hypothetical protein
MLKEAEHTDLLVAGKSSFLPKKIHAVTEFGFLLKVVYK